MSTQQPRPFNVTFVTGASISNAIDTTGGYLYVSLIVPGSIATVFGVASTPFYVQGSDDNVTYRRFSEILTSTVTNDFSVASSVSNRIVPVPYFNARFVKIEASATVTGAVTPPVFKLLCTDSL